MLWNTAASALKWVVDTILKRRADELSRKHEKWVQVADYMEKIAALIESTIDEYRQGKLPHLAYSQAETLDKSFEEVLYQIYDQNSIEAQEKVDELRKAFRKAIHLMDNIDAAILQTPNEPMSSEGQELLIDLASAAGHFKATSMTLRSTA